MTESSRVVIGTCNIDRWQRIAVPKQTDCGIRGEVARIILELIDGYCESHGPDAAPMAVLIERLCAALRLDDAE